MSYNKLVRDKIPDIIKSNNETPITRILSDNEYKDELDKKLLEECNEVILSKTIGERIEELADLLEVIISIAKSCDKSLDNIISVCETKRSKRGSFDKKIYLIDVEK